MTTEIPASPERRRETPFGRRASDGCPHVVDTPSKRVGAIFNYSPWHSPAHMITEFIVVSAAIATLVLVFNMSRVMTKLGNDSSEMVVQSVNINRTLTDIHSSIHAEGDVIRAKTEAAKR